MPPSRWPIGSRRHGRWCPEIWARGRLPLVVGGTGLYVSALVDGHDLASQAGSAEVRRELAVELETEGLPALAARLRDA